MATFKIITNGEDVWPDLKGSGFAFVGEGGKPVEIAVIPDGLRHRLHLRIDLPDGKTVVVETSLRLFIWAADTLRREIGAQ
jgi:uncharacterized protein (AIM24 family)